MNISRLALFIDYQLSPPRLRPCARAALCWDLRSLVHPTHDHGYSRLLARQPGDITRLTGCYPAVSFVNTATHRDARMPRHVSAFTNPCRMNLKRRDRRHSQPAMCAHAQTVSRATIRLVQQLKSQLNETCRWHKSRH